MTKEIEGLKLIKRNTNTLRKQEDDTTQAQRLKIRKMHEKRYEHYMKQHKNAKRKTIKRLKMSGINPGHHISEEREDGEEKWWQSEEWFGFEECSGELRGF